MCFPAEAGMEVSPSYYSCGHRARVCILLPGPSHRPGLAAAGCARDRRVLLCGVEDLERCEMWSLVSADENVLSFMVEIRSAMQAVTVRDGTWSTAQANIVGEVVQIVSSTCRGRTEVGGHPWIGCGSIHITSFRDRA
jgi:hypothetical protein